MNYFFIWLGQHDFDNFSIERSIFGESQRAVSRLSNQISNFRIEVKFIDLHETNIYVIL